MAELEEKIGYVTIRVSATTVTILLMSMLLKIGDHLDDYLDR